MKLNDIERLSIDKDTFYVFVASDSESMMGMPENVIEWGDPALITTDSYEVKKLLAIWYYDPNKILVAQGSIMGPLVTYY